MFFTISNFYKYKSLLVAFWFIIFINTPVIADEQDIFIDIAESNVILNKFNKKLEFKKNNSKECLTYDCLIDVFFENKHIHTLTMARKFTLKTYLYENKLIIALYNSENPSEYSGRVVLHIYLFKTSVKACINRDGYEKVSVYEFLRRKKSITLHDATHLYKFIPEVGCVNVFSAEAK